MSYSDFLNSLGPKRREIAEKAVSLYLGEQAEGVKSITAAPEVLVLMAPKIIGLEDEHLWIIYLNNALRVLGVDEVSHGGMASTVVDVKIVLKNCLKMHGCTRLIIVHNHPSGDCTPSMPDNDVTSKVKAGAKAVGLVLVDHCIVAEHGGFYSYAEHGKI